MPGKMYTFQGLNLIFHLHPSYILTIKEFVTFNSILDPLPPNGGSKTQSVNVLLTDKILTISKFLFNLYKSPAT